MPGLPLQRLVADRAWIGGVATLKAGVLFNVQAASVAGGPFLNPEFARCMESCRRP